MSKVSERVYLEFFSSVRKPPEYSSFESPILLPDGRYVSPPTK